MIKYLDKVIHQEFKSALFKDHSDYSISYLKKGINVTVMYSFMRMAIKIKS